MMTSEMKELVQDIGQRIKAADLIESQNLRQLYSKIGDEYQSKQPLLPRKKDYLEIAHLLPERPLYGGMNGREKSGSGLGNGQLLSDGYNSGSRGSDLGKLLKNGYTSSPVLNGGMYLPVNSSNGYDSRSGKNGKYALEMEKLYCN